MKRTVIVVFVMIFAVVCYAQVIDNIENEFSKLCIKQNSALFSTKSENCLKVKTININASVIEYHEIELMDSIWGKGEAIEAIYDNGSVLQYRLYKGNPFLHIAVSFSNNTSSDISIDMSEVLSLDVVYPPNKKINTLGTAGLSSIEKQKGSYTYSLIVDPESRNAVLSAWLTQFHGMGTFMIENDSYRHSCRQRASLEYGNFIVKSGEIRKSDILIVGFFDDGRDALETYGEHLAKQYDISLPLKPEVYCTWYHRNISGSGASSEKILLENAKFAKKELAPFGLNTFQIDDHWQSSMIDGLDYTNVNTYDKSKIGNGPFKSFAESNFNFPSGMDKMSARLNKQGFTSGIWFMPFAGDCRNKSFSKDIFAKRLWNDSAFEAILWSGTSIDATNPLGEEFLRKRFKRIYDWGYRYFKIDGLHIGAPSENVYIDREYKGGKKYALARLYSEDATFVECFRKGLQILRQEAPDAFLLGCSVTQNMSSLGTSFGLVDAMRVGPDNDGAIRGNWESVIRGADYAGNLYFLNNRVWYNDPDPYYVRETNPLNKARWMVSWQAVSGVMSTTSVQYSMLSSERLDIIKRALPTHKYNARPVDILENEKPMLWTVENERMVILGLFNWSEKDSIRIKYSFDRMGLKPDVTYHSFDFWENRYLGKLNCRIDENLPGASCRVLALREVKEYPQVVSTSRHITQGLIDILDEKWMNESKTLKGESLVVAGDLYEMRIVVPEGMVLKSAVCEKKRMDIKKDESIYRVSYIPDKTGKVDWIITFEYF